MKTIKLSQAEIMYIEENDTVLINKQELQGKLGFDDNLFAMYVRYLKNKLRFPHKKLLPRLMALGKLDVAMAVAKVLKNKRICWKKDE